MINFVVIFKGTSLFGKMLKGKINLKKSPFKIYLILHYSSPHAVLNPLGTIFRNMCEGISTSTLIRIALLTCQMLIILWCLAFRFYFLTELGLRIGSHSRAFYIKFPSNIHSNIFLTHLHVNYQHFFCIHVYRKQLNVT